MENDKMYRKKELENLGSTDMEKFAKHLVRYGKIVKDFDSINKN